MFKVGEYVSYKTEGVCVISDIRSECFGAMGKSEEYYILAPIRDMNSTLYVPVGNKLLTDRMKRLLSAEEICALAEELRSKRLEWIEDSRARNSALRDILTLADRSELIVLVNTLSEKICSLADEGKKHTAGDENIFKRAKKILLDEFSATTDLASEEELMALLGGTHKCYPKNNI